MIFSIIIYVGSMLLMKQYFSLNIFQFNIV